jgi:Zn-dependent protease with chaperone function
MNPEFVSPPAPSLALRATLAVLTFVGFYAFSIALAFGLLYVPYAEWEYTHTVNAQVAIFAAVGAVVIVYSLVPRVDTFEAPGPSLESNSSPRLFAVLRDVAERTGQAMPAEVFLIADVNAWVAQRGGLMGIGSRRVMGIGLPLMEILTVSELRAVIAHEFGHYYGGDTALGPWLYATHSTINRTLENLHEHNRYLTVLFKWYGLGFLRVTHAISRRQELVADALAASVAGSDAMIGGLTNVRRAGVAFDPYWHNEVAPLLDHGYRPPIGEGFRAFLAEPYIARQVAEKVEADLKSGVAGTYDSHPPLNERIAALRALGVASTALDEAPSASLLGNIDAEETRLLSFLNAEWTGPALPAVAWDAAAQTVWIPAWTKMATQFGDRLAGVTPEQLPSLIADLSALARRFGADGKQVTEGDQLRALHVVGCAVVAALLTRGWTVEAPPGAKIRCVSGEHVITPFNSVNDLASGELDHDSWIHCCETCGIVGVDLGVFRPA